MTITVQEPILSAPLHYGEDAPLNGPSTRMRICKIPVSFNGTVTEAVAHCVEVDDNPVQDDAPLKWANFPGYQRPLVGGKQVYLGLFEIHDDGVYLHTVSDTFPKKPIITSPGSHKLTFRIDSPDHCLTFDMTFNWFDYQVALGFGAPSVGSGG